MLPLELRLTFYVHLGKIQQQPQYNNKLDRKMPLQKPTPPPLLLLLQSRNHIFLMGKQIILTISSFCCLAPQNDRIMLQIQSFRLRAIKC